MIETIREYLDSLKGRRVAVVGIGVSNTPLIRMLLRVGIPVTACDKRERRDLGDVADELESLGAQLRLGADYLEELDHDVIFRTPGMRPDVPQLLRAIEKGSELTSEMEVFFRVCPCPILAVTGSDGKTTTTTIISELLKKEGRNVYVGGNIGKPLLADAAGMQPEDLVVLELSSFQLLTMRQSPSVAVVTNVAPNHLDVHKSMEEYIAAKENIFRYQNSDGCVILNADNDITASFAAEAPGAVMTFSRRSEQEHGAYVKDGAIWFSDAQGSREVLPLAEILLPGDHNVENYMAAIAAVNGLVSDETIRAFAREFTGVEHRIELVRTLDGVRYYNDSIASSPTRTIAGLKCFPEKVILIAGGYDKHIPYDVLGPEIVEHVKHLVLTGATADKIWDAVTAVPGYTGNDPDITIIDDFRLAVLHAHSLAEEGDVVILSPASASFDKFKNFMERGDTYKAIVRAL